MGSEGFLSGGVQTHGGNAQGNQTLDLGGATDAEGPTAERPSGAGGLTFWADTVSVVAVKRGGVFCIFGAGANRRFLPENEFLDTIKKGAGKRWTRGRWKSAFVSA